MGGAAVGGFYERVDALRDWLCRRGVAFSNSRIYCYPALACECLEEEEERVGGWVGEKDGRKGGYHPYPLVLVM